MTPTRHGLAVVGALPPSLKSKPSAGLRVDHSRLLMVVVLAGSLCLGVATEALAGPSQLSILQTLLKWTPLLAQGFAVNIAISVAAMLVGTLLGLFLGVARISTHAPVRSASWFITQFFRNAPWLVLLFYCTLMVPFSVRIGTIAIPFPDWLKATLALSLAVMANMAEIVRGAIQSVPTGQWEAADALAFPRRKIIWQIILPQTIKRMLPPWMNLYALLLVSTPLCSIVGVTEVLTLTADALVAESRQELLVPMYGYILLWFFLVCFPVAEATKALEKRFSASV